MIKVQSAVKKETSNIAIGTLSLSAIMLVAFLIFKKFDYTVILGTLLGSGWAILNFFLMGLTVQKATNEENENRSRSIMQFSYSMRMLATLGVGALGVFVPIFNWVAVICPILFPRITIFVMTIKNHKINKKEEN